MFKPEYVFRDGNQILLCYGSEELDITYTKDPEQTDEQFMAMVKREESYRHASIQVKQAQEPVDVSEQWNNEPSHDNATA